MALASERMRAMRARRRARGLKELRLVVPDACSKAVGRRVAKQVANLDRSHEADAMRWIEAVSEFDAPSQVMADKPVTIRRERVGHRIGNLEGKDIARLNIALAFVMGLAD